MQHPSRSDHAFSTVRISHCTGFEQGKILKAQQRLGHRDPSTTLRNYAHALPLDDQDVADDLDDLLNGDTGSDR